MSLYHVRVLARTYLLPFAGVFTLVSACGSPPEAPATLPPYAGSAPASAAAVALPSATMPALVPTTVTTPVATPVLTYPTNPAQHTYPTYPAGTATTTAAPFTKSPTPTPTHAPRCTGSPTGTQILALIHRRSDIPTEPLTVHEGPYCAGDWSFTTVEVVGKTEDEVEPLMVVATGRDSTLALVAAGSDVCTNRVQTTAPPGIRVLACGF